MGTKSGRAKMALVPRGAVGLAGKAVAYQQGDVVFSQGDPAERVMWIRTGAVKISVLSALGRKAVVAVLGAGDFFGEACLAGQSVRMESATAITPSTILGVGKARMKRLLHVQHALSDRFIADMLARSIGIEEDLIGQLFNSCEKRLASRLLVLARYGTRGKPRRVLPKMSQQTLAEMAGTTRARVRLLMNKFERLGFIEQGLGLRIDRSLLNVVLHE
jgi:CRP/FNR family cyclic AMP-dependent transcriptional regulator